MFKILVGIVGGMLKNACCKPALKKGLNHFSEQLHTPRTAYAYPNLKVQHLILYLYCLSK